MRQLLDLLKRWSKSPYVIICLFIVVFFWLDYQHIITYRPQSIHAWRQTDCASQALNYYQKGFKFFKPELHTLISDNKTTGKCAEEFPILMYLAAILYKIFGFHEFLFRGLNSLVFVVGLFYMYKLLRLITTDNFWSSFIPILFFCSPVVAFYANNFISNPPALAITFVGWYFFYKYYKSKNVKEFIICVSLFSLATLLKISEVISLVIALSFLVWDYLSVKIKALKKVALNVFENYITNILIILAGFAVVVAWYFYAHRYNELHNQQYYTFTFTPIWKQDTEFIKRIFNNIIRGWSGDFFHSGIFYMFGLLVLIHLIFIKKVNRFLGLSFVLSILGFLAYALLWYDRLLYHDYYFMSGYLMIFLLLISSVFTLNKVMPRIFNHFLLKLAFVALLWFNLNHAHKETQNRYKAVYYLRNPMVYGALYDIEPYLRSIGIQQTDYVITLPDGSPCFVLYLMNQFGWSGFLGDNSTVDKVLTNIKKGAKYLIINGTDVLSQQHLYPFMTEKVGEYKDAHIFKLDTNNINYALAQPYWTDTICFDMETLAPDSTGMSSKDKRYVLNTSYSIVDTVKFSGQQSCGAQLPGNFMKIDLNDVQQGDVFEITLKGYNCTRDLRLICSAGKELYKQTGYRNKTNNNNWFELRLDCFIPNPLNDGKMTIFINGATPLTAIVDDLLIVRKRFKVIQGL